MERKYTDEEIKAATKIQAVYKGYITRKLLVSLRQVVGD